MGKTRGVHETTPEIRNRMVGMYEAGLGLREIAVALNCSQRTVKRWLNRFDKEGTVETRDRCGRKRATTAEQDEAIVQLASQTTITAAKAVLPALGLSCSVDTVRERLHKAGIHNWSPSRKHLQTIPLRNTDSAGVQQAVWRLTGTQHGKKKDSTKNKPNRQIKKRGSEKAKVQNYSEDNFAQPTQECLAPKQVEDIVPAQPQPDSIFAHSMQPMNVAPCWPLDLVQNNDIPQRPVPNFRDIISMTHQPLQTQAEEQQYHDKNEKDKNCHQYEGAMGNQPENQYMMDPQMEQDARLKYYTHENDDQSSVQENMTGSCGASSSSHTESDNNESSKNNKKGGKIKGTLETTIEIRNRMIGMAEAGLSTLSIALAINRSERTVKRWLERWNKEGNVQTKERKGRKRITTKEQDDAIIAMATQQPLTAAKHVAPALGLKCSVDTIRERLHKAGIHSWKLGKKQGYGNAVHTIHLWQPSGNRPNKLKPPNEKRKKSRKKQSTSEPTVPKEKKDLEFANKPNCEPQKLISESSNELPLPPSYSSAPTVSQNLTDISMATSTLLGPQAQPLNASVQNTPMDIMGPVVPHQPEPCRLMCPTAQAPISCHAPTNSIYSSNAVIINSHPVHMEHPEPMNYEPYIWTF